MNTTIRIMENALDCLKQEYKTKEECLMDLCFYLKDESNPEYVQQLKSRLGVTIFNLIHKELEELIDNFSGIVKTNGGIDVNLLQYEDIHRNP